MKPDNKIPSIAIHLRRVLLVNLLIFISFSIISGQKTKEEQFPFDQKDNNGTPSFKERLFYGGSFGLQFGTITDIQVSPVIGYWVLPRVAVALGPTYRYYKDPSSETAIYGAKCYVQFAVIQDLSSIIQMGGHTGIFLHLEDELLSLNSYFWKWPLGIPFSTERFYLNTLLAGGGISQQIGRRASLNFMVLWPLNDSDYDLYNKPELRISFSF
ncbi:MAG: hypothetical protein WA816_11455 [Bacteroidales bacterium]